MARSAHDYALTLLSARAYTRRDLRRKLAQKEFDPADIDAVMERLEASGLLNDERYAAEYARQKLVSGGMSVRRVELDLARKGIARDVARAAAASVVEEEHLDAKASVERAARKKLLSLGDLDHQVKRRRLFAYLARRGFELDDIKQAVDRVFR
ncbi:MAG: regulatory protein RecX [Gemmatimonadales bacterium]